jgi:hypothetical protein
MTAGELDTLFNRKYGIGRHLTAARGETAALTAVRKMFPATPASGSLGLA